MRSASGRPSNSLPRFSLSLYFALSFCLLVAPACAQGAANQPAAAPRPLTSAAYVLHAGDELDLSFFYNPELNQHAPIRPDGRISMPLLGELQAEGMTVQALTDYLQKAYMPELKRSALSIQLRAAPNQIYYVGGEVEHPGMLPLRGATVTALQAIVEAGGLKQSAAHGGISVLRKTPEGTVEVHTLSVNSKKGETADSARFQMQPLDVLIVSESRISKLDRVMDQYVRKLSPVLLSGGFSYLFGSPLPY